MAMELVAWFAAGLVFASFFMKTIVPLRTVAIASNIVFISYALMGLFYGIFDKLLPILILRVSLLPLNLLRLQEVKTTIRGVREATDQHQSLDYLIPYRTRVSVHKGQPLFQKGDVANCIYLLRQGTVRIVELGKILAAGEVFGEISVFSEHQRRTSSAVCEEDCVLFSITGDKVVELFYQEPRFGFFIVRALSGYLSYNAGLHELASAPVVVADEPQAEGPADAGASSSATALKC